MILGENVLAREEVGIDLGRQLWIAPHKTCIEVNCFPPSGFLFHKHSLYIIHFSLEPQKIPFISYAKNTRLSPGLHIDVERDEAGTDGATQIQPE